MISKGNLYCLLDDRMYKDQGQPGLATRLFELGLTSRSFCTLRYAPIDVETQATLWISSAVLLANGGSGILGTVISNLNFIIIKVVLI